MWGWVSEQSTVGRSPQKQAQWCWYCYYLSWLFALNQGFSHFQLHTKPVGILSQCRVGSSRSGVRPETLIPNKAQVMPTLQCPRNTLWRCKASHNYLDSCQWVCENVSLGHPYTPLDEWTLRRCQLDEAMCQALSSLREDKIQWLPSRCSWFNRERPVKGWLEFSCCERPSRWVGLRWAWRRSTSPYLGQAAPSSLLHAKFECLLTVQSIPPLKRICSIFK